jgi:transcriptional regulator with XRE-family HTH domain
MRVDHHCELCGQRLPDGQIEVPPIAKAIRLARADAGLSQRALAKAAFMSSSFLCDVECGKRTPSYDTLGKIAYACGIKISELCALAEG